MTTPPAHASRRDAREARQQPIGPKRRHRGLWITLVVITLLLAIGGAVGWVGMQVYDAAQATRASLTKAMSGAQEVKAALLAADVEGARAAITATQQSTEDAVLHASGAAWDFAESIPFGVGENVRSVRVVAEQTDTLVDVVADSIDGFDLAALAPQQGAFNLEALTALKTTTTGLATASAEVAAALKSLDMGQLIGPVREGVDAFAAEVQQLHETITPIDSTLGLLPEALGSTGPRNYIVMLQGNSEARSLGGNPAVYLVIKAEDGAISIVNYVDTVEFPNGMAESILPLTDEEVAIYGDKIGRWTPDLTMVPDFPRVVSILDAYWQNSVGTPYDGVISIDPVALSYLLNATGPVLLPDGTQLTAESAAPRLLNGVYFEYPLGREQNEFFAGAAGAIFSGMTAGSPNPTVLISALERATSEGRILYWSRDEEEMAAIAESRLAGSLPPTNDERTVIGAYLNDNTGSKKSYYLDLATTAQQCTAGDTTKASGTVTLSSTLSPEQAAELPYYIRGPHYAAEDISTYVVLYGPVGSTLSALTVDGAPAAVLASGTHLNRPALKVEVLNRLADTHAIAFEFSMPAAGSPAGELEVWSTPMSRATAHTAQPACAGT